MAHRKIKNYQGSYQQYGNLFAAARNQGRKKRFARKFTKAEFDALKAEGTTVEEMIAEQTFSEEVANKAFRQYEYLRDNSQMHAGEKFNSDKQWENSYWGESRDYGYGLGYHTTKSGFLKDGHSIHFMISFEIDLGLKSREEVLADYGYDD